MAKKKQIVPAEPKEFRVAAYLRVSTEDQKDSGLGIEAQTTKVNAQAMVKDWPPPTIYMDEGISGTKKVEQRPGLKKLMEDIEQHKIDALIINSLDRLGRRASIIINLIDQFAIHKVALVSCKESFDTSTPHGQFVTIIFAAIAQLERDQIAMRTIDAMNEKGKIDGEKGGNIPYGYERIFAEDPKTKELKARGLALNEPRAEIVKKIYSLRKENAKLTFIAEMLNTIAEPPRGLKWYPSTVREILSREEVYKGGTRGDSPIHWPAIIEEPPQA